MPSSPSARDFRSAKALTLAAYATFLPIGIVTVLLGPLLPTLSARWSLNYSQAGALINTQYMASTLAVALSGLMVSRWGYRFAMKTGLLIVAAGLVAMLSGSETLGIVSIAAYGAGLGLVVPATNLLVAVMNPSERSAKLNVVNFCWSVGAVSCPFLVAFAAARNHVPLLLVLVAGSVLAVLIGIAVMPASIVEPEAVKVDGRTTPAIDWRNPALLPLSALFFIYVGTENGFGLWIATYSKSLGSMSATWALLTPSFFYISLMLGRLLAPSALRWIEDVRLTQAGLVMAFSGVAGVLLAHELPGIAVSAVLAGLGLSTVYPITITLLSREFGATASKVGSIMFTMANLGGGLTSWIEGSASNRFGTLKAGLAVPMIGSIAMLLLYLRNWKKASEDFRLENM